MDTDRTADDLFRERCERERQRTAGRPPAPYRTERKTKLVAGGDYVVAVEVEVVYPPDLPDEPCYRVETIRRLERVRELAKQGNVAALEKEGTVYVRRDAMATAS